MKVLSKSSEYGLRALLYLAQQLDKQAFVSIGQLSKELDISFHFLTKILQSLTQANLLNSYRGPNGGVAFKIPPEEIFLSDVVRVLEGDDFFENCLLGLPGCGEATPCPMHGFWMAIRGAMQQEFETTTLAQMGQAVQADKLRLTP